MPDIHITRKHALGLHAARQLAFRWAEEAEERLGMECVYEEGKTSDLVTFKRLGAHGELNVTKDGFDLHARLGVLLGVYRDRIETEIVKNLDELLEQKEPLQAFDKAVKERTARPAAKKPPATKKA